jgi:hypothetical protein
MDDSARTLLESVHRMQGALESQASRAESNKAAAASKQKELAALRKEAQEIKIAESRQRVAVAVANEELLSLKAVVECPDDLFQSEFDSFKVSLDALMTAQRQLAHTIQVGCASMSEHEMAVATAVKDDVTAALMRAVAAQQGAAQRLSRAKAQGDDDDDEMWLASAVETAEAESALADALAIHASLKAQLRATTAANDALLRQCADIRVNDGAAVASQRAKALAKERLVQARAQEAAALERDVLAALAHRDAGVTELRALQSAITAAQARLR